MLHSNIYVCVTVLCTLTYTRTYEDRELELHKVTLTQCPHSNSFLLERALVRNDGSPS